MIQNIERGLKLTESQLNVAHCTKKNTTVKELQTTADIAQKNRLTYSGLRYSMTLNLVISGL